MTINRAAQLSLRGDTRQAVASLKRVEMSQRRLGASFDKTTASTHRANRAMLAMNKEAGRLKGAMVGRLGLAGGILGAVMALDAFADRAVEVNNVYKVLKISVDEASQAVTGQVDKLTLARNANKLHLAGIELTSETYGQLTGVIAKASDATGQDLTANLEKATRAIANGNVEALARMGLTLDQRTAEREYAEELGKTVSELTKAERQQIALNLVLTDGVEQTDKMGAATANAAVRWVQLKNAFQDALDQLVFIDKHAKDLADTFGSSLKNALIDATAEALNFMDTARGIDDYDSKVKNLGSSVQIVEGVFSRFHSLQRAQWALWTADIKKARFEFQKFSGTASIKDMAKEAASDAMDRRQAELEANIDRLLRESQERRLQEAAAAAAAGAGEDTEDPPTGGGRRRGRPKIAENRDNAPFIDGTRLAQEANAIGARNRIEREKAEAEELENIRRESHDRWLERHEQILRAEEERRAAQEQHRQAIIGWADTATQAYADVGQAAVNMAALAGASGKKQQAIAAVVEGGVLIAKAVSHQIQAAMAFASFNYPLGVAHQAAAIAGFTNAAVFLAGRVPGGGKRGGGGGRSSGGGGITVTDGMSRGGAANSSRADSAVPLSSQDRQFTGADRGSGSGDMTFAPVFNGPVFDTKASVGKAIEEYRREFKQAGGSF